MYTCSGSKNDSLIKSFAFPQSFSKLACNGVPLEKAKRRYEEGVIQKWVIISSYSTVLTSTDNVTCILILVFKMVRKGEDDEVLLRTEGGFSL